MSALRILAVAFITAIAGGVLGIVCGDPITRWFHVSEMEGGRGMMVIFFCAPLGAILASIIGLIVGIVVKRPGWSGYFRAQGLSILIVAAIAGIFTGIIYLGIDKPPKIDGKKLTLDFELRVPASVKIPDEPNGYDIRASLDESSSQNRYGFIDWSSIVRGQDQITIPGHADLMTHSSSRSLLASVGNEPTAPQSFDLKIPSVPRKQDETWSDWMTAEKRADLAPIPEGERFSMRYRVRKLDR
jgi:MFS family permease